jgi:Holliday junction resolvase RusA-like endonuclease
MVLFFKTTREYAMNNPNFQIPGAPIALQRARSGKHGFYDPQKHVKTAMQIYLSHYEGPLLEGPQFLTAFFFMPIPKSASKRTIQALQGTFHPIKSDLDNCIKYLNDLCQNAGNIFKDDACIAATLALKVWELNDQARTEFQFISLDGRKYKPGCNAMTFLDLFSVF